MGIRPIDHLKLAWHRLIHGAPAGDSAECGYGKTFGAEANCTVIVAPYEGYRHGYSVFCSNEHAAMDQQEQIF